MGRKRGGGEGWFKFVDGTKDDDDDDDLGFRAPQLSSYMAPIGRQGEEGVW